MRAAWLLLAVSACFHPSYDRPACSASGECPAGLTCRAQICEPLGTDDARVDGQIDAAPGIDAVISDGMSDVMTPAGPCWHLDSSSFDVHLAACPPVVAERLDIDADVSIDTGTGTSTSPTISCALISDGPDQICALSAKMITIANGVTLTAHGSRPLALLAHDVNMLGTIDVASHVGQPAGAGATSLGCNGTRGAIQFGGGGGGAFSLAGGPGGDQGTAAGTGAAGGGSITVKSLRGGCAGTGGGGGGPTGDPHGMGGAGGGTIWLSADTGVLTLGNAAVINASGAGGAGGGATNHGGSGGGSGGLIVIHAKMIVRLSSTSLIFAAGGGGGGGALNAVAGGPGHDPTSPAGTAAGGSGGAMSQGANSGNGGSGAPSSAMAGSNGDTSGSGGGGGGGAIGLIWVASDSTLSAASVVPAPIAIGPP
jgi:hypothetical protein